MFNANSNEFVIEDRPQLIYALTEAVALEHVLMCQYLFAGASLKTHLSELSEGSRRYHQLELIRYWKRKLFEVGREEMQHLSMAMNLLVAVGGSPTFDRPSFPNRSRYYKDKIEDGTVQGLELTLEKFSGPSDDPLRTINRFVRFERPHPRARELHLAAIPQPNIYDSVGTLYQAIRDAFSRIPDVILDTADQYDPSDEDAVPVRAPNRPNVSTVVKTVDEAEAMIDQIVDQGEGYPGFQNDPSAHYVVFSRIRDEYERELAADPDFEPARNVIPNPATRIPDDGAAAAVIGRETDDGFQYGLLQLFGGAYELLLSWLGQLFSRGGQFKPPALRAVETLTFLPFMSEVIQPIAELMTFTPVPVGGDTRLGPTFEVTSNDFLIPPLDVSTTLTLERIRTISELADTLTEQAKEKRLDDVSGRLAFVSKTIHLLLDELQSRVQYGWPPSATAWDPKYSETAPSDFKFNFKEYAVLELSFEGVAQCRLATDPDGADVRRGVTGNGFAIGDEPDLDRIIRFQPVGAIERSHCPGVGVVVRSAVLKSRSLAPWADRGAPVPELIGAIVDLVGGAKFEGRNHLVSEDGEPIDPFEIDVRTVGGESFQRGVIGVSINDMTPLQRRGSGRYPIAVALSADAMLANMAVLARRGEGWSFVTPFDYTIDRVNNLKRAFVGLNDSGDPTGRIRADLEFRMRSLDEGLRAPLQPDARPIRWTRYFFDASYRHFLSGPVTASLDGPFGRRFEIVAGNSAPSWLVDYNLGFFDTDAMTMIVRGHIYLPVRPRTQVAE